MTGCELPGGMGGANVLEIQLSETQAEDGVLKLSESPSYPLMVRPRTNHDQVGGWKESHHGPVSKKEGKHWLHDVIRIHTDLDGILI